MNEKKATRKKIVISTISIFLFFSGLILFAQNKVSTKEEIKSKSRMIENQKEKDIDDGIQEYVRVLTKDKKTTSLKEKVEAINMLGNANVKRAIPVLIEYIDLEDLSKNRSKRDEINITEQDDVYPSSKYPAIGALTMFGKRAVPELVKLVEKENFDSLKSKNARQTIQYIFLRGNLLEGITYLEKFSIKSNAHGGSRKIQMVAEELRKLQEQLN